MRSTPPGPRRARRASGFSLIELIVVIAILAVIAGTTLPMVGKTLTRGKIAETRGELLALAPAIGNFFEDTGSFPPTFTDLEQNVSGTAGWAGPYLKALLSAQSSTSISLARDAWNRDYIVTLSGVSALTITSRGPDGQAGSADDLVQALDVTPIRRAATLAELRTLNAAITAWNAAHPLPATLPVAYAALLARLVTDGYLPAGTATWNADAWGDAYVGDPAGVSPVVAVTSIHV